MLLRILILSIVVLTASCVSDDVVYTCPSYPDLPLLLQTNGALDEPIYLDRLKTCNYDIKAFVKSFEQSFALAHENNLPVYREWTFIFKAVDNEQTDVVEFVYELSTVTGVAIMDPDFENYTIGIYYI